MLWAIEDCSLDNLEDAAYSLAVSAEAIQIAMKFIFHCYVERCAVTEGLPDESFRKEAFKMLGLLCVAMAKQKGRQHVYRAITAKAEDDDESVSDLVRKACGAPTARALHRWLRSWW